MKSQSRQDRKDALEVRIIFIALKSKMSVDANIDHCVSVQACSSNQNHLWTFEVNRLFISVFEDHKHHWEVQKGYY